jgi:TRAP transporter TAXI family solute receptor
MRHPILALIAGICGLLALGGLIYYIATLPTHLRIAVGPLANENVRITTEAVKVLSREREAFRLRMIVTEGSEQSSRAVDEGRADLAIVRSDIAYPRSAASVAVMHVDYAVLVAPVGNGVNAVADLKGKSIAVLRDNPGNIKLIGLIAAQAGLAPGDIKIERTRIADLKSALEQGTIHAVMAVGPTSSRFVLDIVNIVTEAGRGSIKFLPVIDNAAIEQRNPVLEADTLVRGLFGGFTPRPEQDTPTLTVSYLLMASKSLTDTTVTDFTRVILNAKSQMAVEAPLAARMEAPDQEKASPIPIHPGTITYLDGQTSSFLERYGDWFYIGIMGLGVLASAMAGYFSWTAARAKQGVMDLMTRTQNLAQSARKAKTLVELDEVEEQMETLFVEAMQQAAASNIDGTAMTAFNMAFAHARDAVAHRRERLPLREASAVAASG